MNNRILGSFYLLMIASFTLTSCIKDKTSNTGTTNPADETQISSNITKNTTWTTGNVYTLKTRVSVEPGVSLKIEPGVIIKGDWGSGANATCLIVAKGAKIDAQGTATQPIIFTSVADNIQPGQITSPNLDGSLNGLWGGVIILGNAPISADNDVMQIEGIPASDPNGQYGGNDPHDNSGIFKYCSIRYGGANIGEGNEINGLTLGGVGDATVISNIEVDYNQDDGIEFFGGTVHCDNVLILNAGDDGLDIDQGFMGSIDNFIVICGGTDHALEIDGPEGAPTSEYCTVGNGSVKGEVDAELADFRDNATGTFQNIYFFGFSDPSNGRGDLSLSSGSDVTFSNGTLKFSDLQVTLPAGASLSDVFKYGVDAFAVEVALGANTVGAKKVEFATWTLADAANMLEDFN